MRDGRTRRLAKGGGNRGLAEFLAEHDVRMVVVSGAGAGVELRIRRELSTLGRGPGVDFTLDDPALSRQHAAIEYAGDEFRIRDLGSTNGVLVNGRPVQVGELRHGDRVEVGSQTFQFLIELHEDGPEVYELSPEA